MFSISVIVPMHNENKNAEIVIKKILKIFKKYELKGEIITVNDRSIDNTGVILEKLAKKNKLIKVIHRKGGQKTVEIGLAIRDGIDVAKFETVAIMMGDLSDDPEDVIRMLKEIERGYDFVIGSRFIKGSYVKDYPKIKLIVNRMCNYFIKLLFLVETNDISNAFKLYRRKILNNIKIESSGFEVFIEIPLKLIKLNYKYTQIPVKWLGRVEGKSKFKILKSAIVYLKFILKMWIS